MKVAGKIICLIIFVPFLLGSCINEDENENCIFINDESRILNHGTAEILCKQLDSLSQKMIGLKVFIFKQMPELTELDNISYSFLNEDKFRLSSAVFINVSNNDFNIFYNKNLKKDTFLIKRELFGEKIYSLLNEKVDDIWVLQIGKEYERLFSD